MNRLVSFAAAAMCVIAFGTSAYAQDAQGAAAPDGPSASLTTCNYPFGSGTLVWCVSTEGNLVSMISPAGNQNMAATKNEGYVICTPTAVYYGLGWGSGGFGAPTTVSLTATSVTIARTTTDGRFTLTQKFTRDTTERDITLQLKLTNHGAQIAGVYLARFAEVGVDNDAGDDLLDGSVDSLWAREAHSFTASPRLGAIGHTSWIGNMLLDSACSPLNPTPLPGGPGQAWFSNRFNVGTMNSGASKIVYLAYRSQ